MKTIAPDIEIKRQNTLPIDFDFLTEKFIDEAGEYERTPTSIRAQILSMKEGALWVIRVENSIAGYFFAEILPTEYGGLIGLIHEVFIDKNFSKPEIINQVDETLNEWAKSCGAKELAFYTRRKPLAFMRLLKNKKWGVDSCVLKRTCA